MHNLFSRFIGVQNIWTPPLAQDNLQLAVSNSFSTGGSGFSKWGVTSYQEAHDIDLTRGKHQFAFGGEVIRTQNNQNDEYNDSGTFSFTGVYSNDPLPDSPHLFNASVVYFSHSPSTNRAVSFLLNDWQIAPLARFQIGLPVNPLDGTDRSLTGVGLDRPNVNAGVPLYISGTRTSKQYKYVNPAAFSVNPLGTFGNAGHLMLRAPSYFDVDSSISRKSKATERVNLDLRVEAFNVMNHQLERSRHFQPDVQHIRANQNRTGSSHYAGCFEDHLLEDLPVMTQTPILAC
jgi:hypothetical protein